MYNIPELERKWFSYKIKKVAKPLFTLFALTAAGLVLFFVLPANTSQKIENDNSKKIITSNTIIKKDSDIQPKEEIKTPTPVSSASSSSSIPTKTKNAVELEPSFNFMYGLEEEVLSYYDEEDQKVEKRLTERSHEPAVSPHQKIDFIKKNESKPLVTKKQIGLQSRHSSLQETSENRLQTQNKNTIVPKTAAPTTKELSISRKNDAKDIQDVVKRFKKNKNPALSLFVAKRFYAMKNYQQSYNYALITNELNSDIEDSWLIFAKSLVKLDQKDMAISTLESYIESSRSIKAKLLLDSIRNGKMK